MTISIGSLILTDSSMIIVANNLELSSAKLSSSVGRYLVRNNSKEDYIGLMSKPIALFKER